jgi:hypothetical protein
MSVRQSRSVSLKLVVVRGKGKYRNVAVACLGLMSRSLCLHIRLCYSKTKRSAQTRIGNFSYCGLQHKLASLLDVGTSYTGIVYRQRNKRLVYYACYNVEKNEWSQIFFCTDALIKHILPSNFSVILSWKLPLHSGITQVSVAVQSFRTIYTEWRHTVYYYHYWKWVEI